ncbi:tail fiber protein [Klebsiella phage VLC4]|uniref:Tail fiber protein n=2 Tax=Drulisvirus TaxID=1920774 RepID=A0A6B9I9X0_9CAUD|nr:tail fiber protein [Klebsiella phage VLC1]QGZ00937.1 tail fiber protein [Klebsiella phage VLC4]
MSRFYADLIISRESATAAVAVDASSVKTHSTLSGGTWGLASASPTGVSVTPTISADGSTLTVTLTAVDNAPRLIWAQLRG